MDNNPIIESNFSPQIGSGCAYKHPFSSEYVCPFAPVGEFDGRPLCFFHALVSREPEHLDNLDLSDIMSLIKTRKITVMPDWNVPGINLEFASLKGFEFLNTTAVRANFSSAILDESQIGFCDFSFSKFALARANLARFARTKLLSCDFTGTEMSQSHFNKCILAESKLNRARFFASRIKDCDISGTNASNADFSSAELTNVCMKGSLLQKTRFRFSKLINVDFSRCDLRGADFTGAVIENSVLTGANLKNVQGLGSPSL